LKQVEFGLIATSQRCSQWVGKATRNGEHLLSAFCQQRGDIFRSSGYLCAVHLGKSNDV